jgi:hypothetical protein
MLIMMFYVHVLVSINWFDYQSLSFVYLSSDLNQRRVITYVVEQFTE